MPFRSYLRVGIDPDQGKFMSLLQEDDLEMFLTRRIRRRACSSPPGRIPSGLKHFVEFKSNHSPLSEDRSVVVFLSEKFNIEVLPQRGNLKLPGKRLPEE